ncbi:hypothetical protein LEMLEM_LOCUS26777, partial [Lemmus lemmus]
MEPDLRTVVSCHNHRLELRLGASGTPGSLAAPAPIKGILAAYKQKKVSKWPHRILSPTPLLNTTPGQRKCFI